MFEQQKSQYTGKTKEFEIQLEKSYDETRQGNKAIRRDQGTQSTRLMAETIKIKTYIKVICSNQLKGKLTMG